MTYISNDHYQVIYRYSYYLICVTWSESNLSKFDNSQNQSYFYSGMLRMN